MLDTLFYIFLHIDGAVSLIKKLSNNYNIFNDFC
jgi:hypothetical protein